MDSIKVNKRALLAKLKENRANHSAEFEKAAAGYRAKVIQELERRLTDARAGKLPNLMFALPLPVDQTKAYDRVIGMLEMTIEEVVALAEHDYQQYVLDEWAWSVPTKASNTFYTGGQ